MPLWRWDQGFVSALLIQYFIQHTASHTVEPCTCLTSFLRKDSLPIGAPLDYGHDCRVHDSLGCYANYGPNSLNFLWHIGGNNDWCCKSWCYVSADCPSAQPSTLDGALHYSYDACEDNDVVALHETCDPMSGMSADAPSSGNNKVYSAGVPSALVGSGFSLLTDSSVKEIRSPRKVREHGRHSAPPRRGKGGTSSGGGRVGGTSRSVSHSRTMYRGHPATFGVLIMMNGGSRRRYGTYQNETEGSCVMRSAEVVTSACGATIGNASFNDTTSSCSSVDDSCCYTCLECTTEVCMKAIAGCEEFMYGAFEACEWEEEEGGIDAGAFVGIIVTVLFVCFCCCFCIMWRSRTQNQDDSVATDFQEQQWSQGDQMPMQQKTPVEMVNYADNQWATPTNQLTNHAQPNGPQVLPGTVTVVQGTVIGGTSTVN